jgi:DNA-binding LacI/PurR family transcriptional regulator
MKPDIHSPEPLSLQISNIIEQKIVNKEIPVGQKLPTEENLCKNFNVSLLTLRSALARLEKGGYLSRRPRYGTFVISSELKKEIDLIGKNEIALVVCAGPYTDTTKNLYYSEILKGVEKKVKEKDIYLIYTTLKDGEKKLFPKGREKDIAGLIVTGEIIPEYFGVIKKSRISFVLIGDVFQKTKPSGDIDVIGIDDFAGHYRATKYLIGLRHERIAYITPFRRYPWEIEQLKGYEQAHKEAGIVCDKNLLIETEKPDYDGGYIAMKKFLKKSIPFTALFCSGPDLDMGAVKVLEEEGFRIPEDISVVTEGSDQFTSVNSDAEELGKAGVERLIEKITNPDLKPKKILIPQELIVRNSAIKLNSSELVSKKKIKEVSL